MSWMGNRLKIILDSRGVTKNYLINAVGSYGKNISLWYQGKRDPNIKSLAEIVKALKLTPAELYMIVTGEEWDNHEDDKINDIVQKAIRDMRKAIKEKPPEKQIDDDYITHVGYSAAQMGREK